MQIYLGDFELGKTIFFPFCTYNAAGASVTITGLAVTDIEIFKGASITQRSSDAGYALVDTDGIDIDGITGLHGFTIDTSDNTDAGFFAAGNDYTVVVSTITADSQTVTFIAGRFSLINRAGSLSLIDSGTAAAIADGTITLRSGHGITNAASILVVLSSGTNAKGKSRIATYSGSGDVFNVSPAWNANGETTPSGTIIYQVYPLPLASTSDPIAVNVTQIGGVAQSVTDLKDFADTGYDPVAHKVTGVVLADTVTTYTGNTPQTGDAFARLGAPAGASVSADIATKASPAQILTTALTEAYAADGAAGTLSEILFGLQAFLQERSVSGTALTVKKLDGSTTAMVFTLNNGTAPTSLTRAS